MENSLQRQAFFWAQIQQTALNWNAEKSSFWALKSSFWALKSSFWASKSSFWTFKSSFWTFKSSFWAFGSNFDVILCFSLIFWAKLVFLTFWRQLLPENGKIWGVLEASLWPKIEFFDFWNRVFGKNRVFGFLKKSSFCQNAQKKSLYTHQNATFWFYEQKSSFWAFEKTEFLPKRTKKEPVRSNFIKL